SRHIVRPARALRTRTFTHLWRRARNLSRSTRGICPAVSRRLWHIALRWPSCNAEWPKRAASIVSLGYGRVELWALSPARRLHTARRFGSGNHGAIYHSSLGLPRSSTGVHSQRAGPGRFNGNPADSSGVRNCVVRNPHDCLPHWTRVDNNVARNRRETSRRLRVGIAEVWKRASINTPRAWPVVIVVIVIRDIGDVHDPCVADVYIAEVTSSHAVPGEERFPIPERAPAKASAESERDTPVRTAEPGHQCRCPYWTYVTRSRYPSPIAAKVRPPAVVEWRKSPGSIVDPRPPPRIDPDPVAETIRSPTGCDCRHPNRSICGHGAPGAVVIQVFVSDYAGCDVARGVSVILTTVADTSPIIESIGPGIRLNGMRQRRSSGEARALM